MNYLNTMNYTSAPSDDYGQTPENPKPELFALLSFSSGVIDEIEMNTGNIDRASERLHAKPSAPQATQQGQTNPTSETLHQVIATQFERLLIINRKLAEVSSHLDAVI